MDWLERILAEKDLVWRSAWLDFAKERWNDKFLGIYYYDEPGGIWLDSDWESYAPGIWNPNSTYADIAQRFTRMLRNDAGFRALEDKSITAFISDYVLHWFDYLGYDVVFAQLGWNHTLEQDIGLVRGAARLQKI